MKGHRSAKFFVGQAQAYQSLVWSGLFPTLSETHEKNIKRCGKQTLYIGFSRARVP